MLSNAETLSKATKTLMLKEPFYGLFLIMMNKKWSKQLPTAGVSKNNINVQLSINPTFWEHLPQEHKVGILKHELLHVCFQHLSLRDRYSHKLMFNIAADLEINQYIDRTWLPGGTYNSKESFKEDLEIFSSMLKEKLEKGELTPVQFKEECLKLPMRVLFLEDYPDLDLLPKQGTDYYYKKLMETMDEKGNSSDPNVQELLDQAGNGDEHYEHITWEEFNDLSESEKKLIQKQIEYQLKGVREQVSKSTGRGVIPGEMQGILDALNYTELPKFPWKAYLRNFIGGSTETFVRKTRRKFSKRFPKAPGLRVKEKLHILIGVDTSGSVNDEELAIFFQEIHHMHKTGTEITVIQCDISISNVSKYRKAEDGAVKIYGRGGTSFDPVVDYYNENKEFSCLIYFTDGEAPAPQNNPRGRTLWVITNGRNAEACDHLPGKAIKLDL